jgi:hypothetical protein
MTTTETITIHELEYHRNGVGGEPFYACRFTDPIEGEFVATIFRPDAELEDGETDWSFDQGFHNPRVAVLKLDLLPSVTFGHNSWRGDNYASALYDAIRERERN